MCLMYACMYHMYVCMCALYKWLFQMKNKPRPVRRDFYAEKTIANLGEETEFCNWENTIDYKVCKYLKSSAERDFLL